MLLYIKRERSMVMKVARCPECNVPELFSQTQVWLNNGDIVQRINPQLRMGLIECENLDPVFKNIGDIIGIPVERMIVNICARAVEVYMRSLIPPEVRDMIIAKQMDPSTFAEPTMTLSQVSGWGKYEALGLRYERDENDYGKYRITKPFSLPLAAGAMAGASSSVVGGQHEITYEEVAPDVYEFTTSWAEYPEELMERFGLIIYEHRDGDIELERCATCGIPKALSSYRWELDDGLILNEHTGRRMAMLGPGMMDLLFEELERELGETIPEVVVEAQRRFTRTGFYTIEQVSDEGDFRTQLALRGLGNLKEIRMEPAGLFMRIDNVVGHLLTVGMVQGLYEMAFDIGSTVDWARSEEGNLEVQVVPKA
jgi:hypothetical protein